MSLIKIHKVRSSTDPNTIYDVQVHDDGFIACGCIFWEMKCFSGSRDCKHSKFIREKYYNKINHSYEKVEKQGSVLSRETSRNT